MFTAAMLNLSVAPRAGAWIETKHLVELRLLAIASRPPRGGVD